MGNKCAGIAITFTKEKEIGMKPTIVLFRSFLYPIINYPKKYPGDDTVNYAKGEITKPTMSTLPEDIWIGRRFLGDGRDDKGEYDTISIYLGLGYFKLISKVY